MGNAVETYSKWEPQGPQNSEDIGQVTEIRPNPRPASPPRITDINQQKDSENVKNDFPSSQPTNPQTPIVVTSNPPKTTPTMKWTRVISKVQAVNKFTAGLIEDEGEKSAVQNPEIVSDGFQNDAEMTFENPEVDPSDFPFDPYTRLDPPKSEKEENGSGVPNPVKNQFSLSQLISGDIQMESDDEDKSFDTPETHTETSSSSQSHVSSTSSTEDFSSPDSPQKFDKPEEDLNHDKAEPEQTNEEPQKPKKRKTKAPRDEPVEILDTTDYSNLPRDHFVEAPRRSKRNRSDSSDTSPKQPKPKRKKIGVPESTATPPKSSPTKSGDPNVVRSTASKKNYGATPARPSPSVKKQSKVAKTLNYEDVDVDDNND